MALVHSSLAELNLKALGPDSFTADPLRLLNFVTKTSSILTAQVQLSASVTFLMVMVHSWFNFPVYSITDDCNGNGKVLFSIFERSCNHTS